MFLRFMNFYHRFIIWYFFIIILLRDYLKTLKGKKKPKKVTLNLNVKVMFMILKSAFKKALLLIYFNLKIEIRLEINASIITFIKILI